MRKSIFLITLLVFTTSIFAQTYTVSGGLGTPYAYKKESDQSLTGTGIEEVYLFNTLASATIKYSSSSISVRFYKYKQSFGDKIQIPDSDISITSINGNSTYTVSNLEDGYGYFAEDNNIAKSAVWIIDYNRHKSILSSIEAKENDEKCEFLKLLVGKTEDKLFFYTTNGSRREIPRKYTVSYDIQEWNENNKAFVKSIRTLNIDTEETIDAPLMNTVFKLKGDQFAEYFKMPHEKSSEEYKAIAVEGHIVAEQEGKNNGEIGSSAPVTVNLYARGSDAAYFYTWSIYNKEDTANYIVRYTGSDVKKYTFEKDGNYVIKLEVANNADQSATCVNTTRLELNIEESDIKAPNYFSPGGTTNAEFKVYYKSIIKFKCTIFNRWGVKIYQWNDPSKGWDGRHNGKFVSTGVYYYVIEYTNSKGRRKSMGGDINVLRRN